MDKTAAISIVLIEEIFKYLISRPYSEVAAMVAKLHMEVNQQSQPASQPINGDVVNINKNSG